MKEYYEISMDFAKFHEVTMKNLQKELDNFQTKVDVYNYFRSIPTDLPILFNPPWLYQDGCLVMSIWKEDYTDLPVEEVREIRKLLSEHGLHGTWKRNFNETDGKFEWKLTMDQVSPIKNEDGTETPAVPIEFAGHQFPHIMISITRSAVNGCKVTQVTETVTRYKSECNPEVPEELEGSA